MIEVITKEMKTLIISLILLSLGCNPATTNKSCNEPIGAYHNGDAGTSIGFDITDFNGNGSVQAVEEFNDPYTYETNHAVTDADVIYTCDHYYVHRAWPLEESVKAKLYMAAQDDGRECICIKCYEKNICY
jgi:hypothetical protein